MEKKATVIDSQEEQARKPNAFFSFSGIVIMTFIILFAKSRLN